MMPISAQIAEPARPMTDQAERHGGTQQLLGAELLEVVVALQAEHHSGEQAGHQDDDKRTCADKVDLPDDGVGGVGRSQDVGDGGAEEYAGPADALQQVEEFPP
jgi:hypothetical protein